VYLVSRPNRNRNIEISTAPQKRYRGNQIIHRRLSETKSIREV